VWLDESQHCHRVEQVEHLGILKRVKGVQIFASGQLIYCNNQRSEKENGY